MMIHVILSSEDIQRLTEALHYTVRMLKEKDPENGLHFAPMYQDLKDRLDGIQKAADNLEESTDEES